MRIQVVRTPTIDSIDGIQLDGYQVGREYDVGTVLGSLLLAEGWAVPADDVVVATAVSSREVRKVWGSTQARALAADRRRRVVDQRRPNQRARKTSNANDRIVARIRTKP
jgi:hypothetical protein